MLTLSRPRFWLYLIGPFLLGAAATAGRPADLLQARYLLWFLFWSFPANFFVYGINDLFDADTDAVNGKKAGYETAPGEARRRRLPPLLAAVALSGLVLAAGTGTVLPYLLWLFLAGEYSAPPLRFKARPFLDAASNVLYVVPALLAAALGGGGAAAPALLGGWAWCAAMHAVSAIPDITADRSAGIATTATRLGVRGTALLCAGLYALAGLLAAAIFPLALLLLLPYLALCAAIFRRGTEKDALTLYRRFPLVNGLVGFALTFGTLLIRFG